MSKKEDPNFYAIIPATVRYDEKLTMGARLLYGEITALCHKEGYCWATNKYFGDLYKKSKTTISKWVSQLESSGHISCDLVYREGSKEIEGRYIRLLNHPTQENLHRVHKKKEPPYPRKLKDPTQENLKDSITVNNTSTNTINNTLNSTVDSPPSNNSISSKDQKKEDPLPPREDLSVQKFSQRLIDYLNKPGTPDFFWECFEEVVDWSKKKDVYIDWQTEEGFDKNRKAAAELFSRIRIATGKDETGEGMQMEIKKFLKKIDDWWYNNGISVTTLNKNFEKIFNSKPNGKSKRDNKPEPGDYKAEAEKIERGEFFF